MSVPVKNAISRIVEMSLSTYQQLYQLLSLTLPAKRKIRIQQSFYHLRTNQLFHLLSISLNLLYFIKTFYIKADNYFLRQKKMEPLGFYEETNLTSHDDFWPPKSSKRIVVGQMPTSALSLQELTNLTKNSL